MDSTQSHNIDELSHLYRACNLPDRILENMRKFYIDKKCGDFMIKVRNLELVVNKAVLISSSKYFERMFSHSMIEAHQNKVELTEMNPEVMREILDFCYTAEIRLDMDNVQDVLFAASYLQIMDIVNFCSDYLQKKIAIDNCIGVMLTASRCGGTEKLYNFALDYCLYNFKLVSNEREFYEIDESTLINIITDDRLEVDDEVEVLNAIIRWSQSSDSTMESPISNAERGSRLESLMQHVRFPLMDAKTLVALSRENRTESFRSLIEEAKDYHLLQQYPQEISLMNGPRFRPRWPLRRRQRIYALGGWTNKKRPTPHVEVYDPYEDRWKAASPMERPLCGVGVAILDNYLYAIAGHDGSNYLKSVTRYDISRDEWSTDVADMSRERTSIGVVTLGKYIYAIGGQSHNTCFNTVERYNPETNCWENCPPLLTRRLGPGVTVLNNKIYVTGGADKAAMDTVECYDPVTTTWTEVARMINCRKHHGCIAYDNKIYVVGGRGESGDLNTAECYDPITNEWQLIAEMETKRSGLGLCEVDGILYCMGGNNNEVKLNSVEAYDPVKNTWTSKRPMMVERLGGGFVVAKKIPSVFTDAAKP